MQKGVLVGSLLVLFGANVAALSAGCGGDDGEERAGSSGSSQSSTSSGQAGSSSGGSSSSSGGSSGSSSSGGTSSSSGHAGELVPTSCDGACRATTLTATNGETSASFHHVRFGFRGDDGLRVEAHRGGVDGCADEDSPTPELTLLLLVPRPLSLEPLSLGAATATFFDFKGDISPEFPPPKASALALTSTAARLDSSNDALYAFDVQADFENGAVVEGHGFATYCPGLDEE